MTAVVLGFSGRVASGKSSLAAAVAEALGMPRISFGGYVRHVADYLGLDMADRKVLQHVGNFLVTYPGAFCAKVLEQATYQPGQPLIIDGIRHREIADELRLLVAPATFALIYVTADEATLRGRLTERGELDFLTRQLENDATEEQVRVTLPGLADLTVNNAGDQSLEDIRDEILRWISNIEGA